MVRVTIRFTAAEARELESRRRTQGVTLSQLVRAQLFPAAHLINRRFWNLISEESRKQLASLGIGPSPELDRGPK